MAASDKVKIELTLKDAEFLIGYGRKSFLREDYSAEEFHRANSIVKKNVPGTTSVKVSGTERSTMEWLLKPFKYNANDGPVLHIENDEKFYGLLAWLPDGIYLLSSPNLSQRLTRGDLHQYRPLVVAPEFAYSAKHRFDRKIYELLKDWKTITDEQVVATKKELHAHLKLPELFTIGLVSAEHDQLKFAVISPQKSQQGWLYAQSDGFCRYEPLTK